MAHRDILAAVRERSRTVIARFLWILLAVVAATILINLALRGPEGLALRAFAPNLVFAGVILWSLGLVRRGRERAGLLLILVPLLVLVCLQVALAGLEDGAPLLLLFFVPVVLAGLLLDRTALYLIALASVATVAGTAYAQSAGLHPVPIAEPDAVRVLALQFSIVFGLIVFFMDRFGLSLHEALATAADREAALVLETEERVRAEATLRGERSLNEAILEGLPGVFLVVDRRGGLVRWNANLERVSGRSGEALARLDVGAFLETGGPIDLEAVLREGTVPPTQALLVGADGRRTPYLFTAAPVAMFGETYLAGFGIDKSDLSAAEVRIEGLNRALSEQLGRLTSLREIDRAITGSMDLGVTLEVALKQVTDRLGVDAASVLLYEPTSQALRFGAARGFRGAPLRTTNLRLGQGLAGRAALRRERVLLDDAAVVARAFEGGTRLAEEGFAAYAAVPLVAKGQLQGVLELFHRARLEPSESWLDFLDALALQVAIALDNAAMFAGLERSNEELRLAYDTTIEGWARALDLRDEETEGHSRRVTELTVRLAERFGMGEEEIVQVRRGALLHDIGKMGIPDGVLRKPGALDAEEWELMKRHPEFAHRLLSPIAFLRPALDIPYAHHEKWDGSGYPRGLKGEEIPLAARLFAVVDVYDALTNVRPYRPAWTRERALAHIREQAGRHFDPAVVEAFLALEADPAER